MISGLPTHHASVSLQRQLTPNLVVEGSYIGKIGKKIVGTITSTPRLSSIRQSPAWRRRSRPSRSALRSAPESSPGNRDCLAISSEATITACSCEWTRMARTFSFIGVLRLVQDMTNQPENTTGLISNIPNPFDLDSLWGPSILDRRHVFAASWVWSPQRIFSNAISNALLNGWPLTGFHRFQSGSPWCLRWRPCRA